MSRVSHTSSTDRFRRSLSMTSKSLFFLIVTNCLFTTITCLRVGRQTPDNTIAIEETEANNGSNQFTESDFENLINFSELKNLNLKELLEINFINNSVNTYHHKFKQVHSSLQDRVKNIIADVQGGGNGKSNFSPELRAKLNESFLHLVESLKLSPFCLSSLNHIRLEILGRRLWPLKFIDAMELLPTGTIEGLLSSVGLYEECVNIVSPEIANIRGQYCLAKVHLPFLNPTFPDANDIEMELDPHKLVDISQLSSYAKRKALLEKFGLDFETLNNKLKLLQMINMFNGSHYRVGVCFPSTCTPHELEYALNKFLEPIQNPIHIEIEKECKVLDQELILNNYQRFAILLLVGLSCIVGACTCYEYYMCNMCKDDARKSTYHQYLITFSALSNTQALFENDCDKRLSAVDSIVLVFVCFEFVGRSYVLPAFYGMMNIKRPLRGLPNEYFTAKKFFFIRGSSFAACTYVLASAIILAYNICAYKQTMKPSSIRYLKYVLNRWLSYARRLIGPILLVYLIPLLGDGPFWHYHEKLYAEPCKHNLLPTFLFYSNFANSLDEVCIPPSVILSTLFYLSLTAPFILYVFHQKMIGYVTLIGLVVAGSIACVVPKFVFNLPVAPFEVAAMSSVSQAKHSFLHYFAGTDQLVVVFVCGLYIGYIIRCKSKIDLGSKFTKLMIWLGMLALPFISTEWNEGFKPLEGNFSQFSFVTWFILSKIMWSCGFGWLLFACCSGRGGPVNDALSMQLIRPLGKLAFGVYLNHITILSFRQLNKKEVGPLTHIEILTDDISDMVIAFGVSYTFYILIEKPFYYWTKIFLGLNGHDEPHGQAVNKRFGTTDLENGKFSPKEEIDLKPLNDELTKRCERVRAAQL